MKKYICASAFLIISIVSSCIAVQNSDLNTELGEIHGERVNQKQCIAPLFESSMPFGEVPFADVAAVLEEQFPVEPIDWQKITQVPNSDIEDTRFYFSRLKNGTEELWVGVINQGQSQIWIYEVRKDNWIAGPLLSMYADLLTDIEGNVWIYDRTLQESNNLFKINEQKETIEAQTDIEGLINEGNLMYFSIAPDGELWFIQADGGKMYLLSFDPKSLIATRHFDPAYYLGLSVDQHGNVFTVESQKGIRVLLNKTGDVVNFSIPRDHITSRINEAKFLFANDGRVWLNDILWFRLEKQITDQHLIFRSPVFVTKSEMGLFPWEWERPEPQADTADGRIWYRSTRGLTWHQPETGEWCMFTTAQSNIVKDSEENLWIIYDNSLYMLPASETKARDD